MSQRKLSLFPERFDQGRTSLCSAQRTARGMGQLLKVGGAEVGNSMAFPVSPDVFSRIEFRRISGKSGQNDATSLSLNKEADYSTAMHRQPIPDNQQVTRQLTQKMPEEVHHLWRSNCARIQSEIEFPPGDPGNDREVFPVEMKLQYRRLASRRPSTGYVRAFTQPTFIDKDYRSAFPEGFF